MQIVLIEDEPRILGFVGRGLEAEGYSVALARDGDSGLARALLGDCALVVLDLLLPGRDGLAVLAELRELRPDLPVMILSARSDLATKLRGFELGASDYVAKPFALDELIARIRVQLNRHGAVERNCVIVGAVQLDLSRREARVGAVTCALSDREFRLLRHLVEHQGEVVSRERLLSEVWGYHFDPGSNVVDVCVRRLRKKLGPEAPIQTVRHAGYRLAAA